jgi:hypothetical protein
VQSFASASKSVRFALEANVDLLRNWADELETIEDEHDDSDASNDGDYDDSLALNAR